jgi:hypothetical protein
VTLIEVSLRIMFRQCIQVSQIEYLFFSPNQLSNFDLFYFSIKHRRIITQIWETGFRDSLKDP